MKYPPKIVVINWLSTVWNADLPSKAKLVASNLHMNMDVLAESPSVNTIARQCSISESTARRALQLLCREGWLINNGQSPVMTNRYSLSLPWDFSGELR